MIAENLKYVNERIQKSCLKAGRDEKEVTLIAVSKTKPVSDLMEAYQEGCREFGENKVQELVDKYEVMPKDIHWHMIGHLQTNKVKYIVDKVTMIHSVDSIKLAREISKRSTEETSHRFYYSQVDIAGEESKVRVHKHGEAEPASTRLHCDRIKICYSYNSTICRG